MTEAGDRSKIEKVNEIFIAVSPLQYIRSSKSTITSANFREKVRLVLCFKFIKITTKIYKSYSTIIYDAMHAFNYMRCLYLNRDLCMYISYPTNNMN